MKATPQIRFNDTLQSLFFLSCTVQPPLSFPDHVLRIVGSCEVIADVGTKIFQGFHPLQLSPIDDKWRKVIFPPPWVNGLVSLYRMRWFLQNEDAEFLTPVGCLFSIGDQNNALCVISKLQVIWCHPERRSSHGWRMCTEHRVFEGSCAHLMLLRLSGVSQWVTPSPAQFQRGVRVSSYR